MKKLTSKQKMQPVQLEDQVGEMVLVYKKIKSIPDNRLSSSADSYREVAAVIPEGIREIREVFYAVFLNRANNVIGKFKVSEGGMNATVVDPKLIFCAALKCGASGIILAHNHPSGSVNPSEQDRRLTKRLSECGGLLDITVLDHIIVGSNGKYFSFADEGML